MTQAAGQGVESRCNDFCLSFPKEIWWGFNPGLFLLNHLITSRPCARAPSPPCLRVLVHAVGMACTEGGWWGLRPRACGACRWAGGRGEIGPWANLVSPLKPPLHRHPCQRTPTHTHPDPALYHHIHSWSPPNPTPVCGEECGVPCSPKDAFVAILGPPETQGGCHET